MDRPTAYDERFEEDPFLDPPSAGSTSVSEFEAILRRQLEDSSPSDSSQPGGVSLEAYRHCLSRSQTPQESHFTMEIADAHHQGNVGLDQTTPRRPRPEGHEAYRGKDEHEDDTPRPARYGRHTAYEEKRDPSSSESVDEGSRSTSPIELQTPVINRTQSLPSLFRTSYTPLRSHGRGHRRRWASNPTRFSLYHNHGFTPLDTSPNRYDPENDQRHTPMNTGASGYIPYDNYGTAPVEAGYGGYTSYRSHGAAPMTLHQAEYNPYYSYGAAPMNTNPTWNNPYNSYGAAPVNANPPWYNTYHSHGPPPPTTQPYEHGFYGDNQYYVADVQPGTTRAYGYGGHGYHDSRYEGMRSQQWFGPTFSRYGGQGHGHQQWFGPNFPHHGDQGYGSQHMFHGRAARPPPRTWGRPRANAISYPATTRPHNITPAPEASTNPNTDIQKQPHTSILDPPVVSSTSFHLNLPTSQTKDIGEAKTKEQGTAIKGNMDPRLTGPALSSSGVSDPSLGHVYAHETFSSGTESIGRISQASSHGNRDNVPQATNFPASQFNAASYSNTGPANQPMMPPPVGFSDPSGGNSAMPPYANILFNLPFAETSTLARPHTFGVIKMTKIPHAVNKVEVAAFFGHAARFVEYPQSSGNYGIHPIVDRIDGRTRVVYVEFETWKAASDALYWVNMCKDRKAPRKLGLCVPDLALSNQAELMKAVFPRAQYVTWNMQVPTVELPRDPSASRFSGFINDEELFMIKSAAETNLRRLYSPTNPARPWEMIITIIQKYPWWATAFYTMHERHKIFDTFMNCVLALGSTMNQERIGPAMLPLLWNSLLTTGVNCVGFTEFERAMLCRHYNFAPRNWPPNFRLGDSWPFFALHLMPGAGLNHLESIVSILRQSETDLAVVPLHYVVRHDRAGASPWGFLRADLWPTGPFDAAGGPGPAGSLTMAEVGDIELAVVRERVWLVLGVREGRIPAPANAPGIGDRPGPARAHRA